MVGEASKPRVTVLMGGTSGEHEISMLSGRGVVASLRELGYRVRDVVVGDEPLTELLAGDDTDVVFVALHGGEGEDGTVQTRLEEIGLPYTGSGPEASRLAMNKVEAKRIMMDSGIRTPAFVELEHEAPLESARGALDQLGLPVVVKPVSEGSTLGISIVKEEIDLSDAVDSALAYGEGAFVEEYIAGRELAVGILGGDVLPVVEVRPSREFYDYSAKYKDKGTEYITEVDISAKVTDTALAAAGGVHKALGCRDMSRTDMRLSKDNEVFVLELNTIPGLTERSLLPLAAGTVGLSYAELIERLVLMAYRRGQGDVGA